MVKTIAAPFASGGSAITEKAEVDLGRENRPERSLFAKFQFLRDGLIAGHVRGVQVIEQAAALADHHQQSAARTVILLIALKMLGQVINALGEQGDLDVCRTGIPLVDLKITNRFRFRFHTNLGLTSLPQFKFI